MTIHCHAAVAAAAAKQSYLMWQLVKGDKIEKEKTPSEKALSPSATFKCPTHIGKGEC